MRNDHNNMKIVIKKDLIIIMHNNAHFFKLGSIVRANDIPFQYLYPYLLNGYAELFQEAPKTDWIETVFYRDAIIKNLSAFGTLSKFKNIETNLPCSYYIAKFNIPCLTVFDFNKKLVELDNIRKNEVVAELKEKKDISKVAKK